MEEQKPTDEQKPAEEAKKENISALEYNIKNKGETSYYYAHKNVFEEKDPNAITVSGPGIITGGDPILLETKKKPVEIIQEPKKITKYIFYDDDKFAVVKIELPQDALDITDECLDFEFQNRSFKLKINVPNCQPYFFTITKLYLKILPDKSKCKLVNTKNGRVIKISFCKEEEDEEWSKLTA